MAAPKLMRMDTKGSRLSLSSASSNIDVSEIGELRRFLQRQFDKQEELLSELNHGMRMLSIKSGGLHMSGSFDLGASVSLSPDGHLTPGRQLSPGQPETPRQQPQTPPSKPTVVTPPSQTPAPPLELPPALKWQATGEVSDPDESFLPSRPSTKSNNRNTVVPGGVLQRTLQARKQAQEADEAKDLPEVLHGDVGPAPTWNLRVRKIVLSPLFSNIVMVFIVLNAIMLGVEIDVSAAVGQNDVPPAFGAINMAFVFVFVMETLLKMWVLGCHEYWRGTDRKWNIFDFIIVGLSVAEMILDFFSQAVLLSGQAEQSSSIRIFRALRLARTLRGVRLFRLLRYFAALRGLLLSIASTLSSLLWTLVLLQLLFYVFAVIFAQLVTDHCRFQTIEREGDPNAIPVCDADLSYWSNVVDSMHTLFMSITGGINWEDAYEPLKKVSLVAVALMNLFIVIGFFTILNVVTGVFVNTAIEGAAADKDMATLKQAQHRTAQIAALRDVFQEVSKEQRDTLRLEDLEDALHEDKLGAFMQSLGISTDDIWTLFLLIDVDANGTVDIEEFVSGCMQLRGPAQSLQVAKMSYDNKLTRQRISQIARDLDYVQFLLTKLFTRRPKAVVSQNL